MWTPEVIKTVIKDAYDLLSSGHHHKGALAVDASGASTSVTSPDAVAFCEWGAIDKAILMLEVVEYGTPEFLELENKVNDVLNAANPSTQYEEYRTQNGNPSVTFKYNDSLLTTDEVVQRFKNGLNLAESQPELVKALTSNPVKGAKPAQHIFAADD